MTDAKVKFCTEETLEQFRHSTPLSEVNNSVDDRPLLLAPSTVELEASDVKKIK